MDVGQTTGVDTVAYSYEIRGIDDAPGDVTELVDRQTGARRTLRRLDGGGTLRTGVGDRAVVEASIPKRLHGHNVHPVSWAEAADELRSMWTEAREYVRPLTAFGDGRVVRIDAVRDFAGVHGFQHFAGSLEQAVKAPRVRSRLYRDRARRGSLTLALGNSQWRAALYDKFAESMREEARGQIRYEARLGRRWAERAGVSLVSEGSLLELARERFTTCGFGRTVGGMQEVLGKVLEASGLSKRERASFLGVLWAEAWGCESDVASRNTVGKYRRIARDLGLALRREDAPAVSARLDYESGRLQVEVAA